MDGIVSPLSAWWSTPAPQWLKVDLEKPYLLDRIEVFPYWDGGRIYQYTVEISQDGHTWVEVADRSTNTDPSTGNGDLCVFEPAEARYLRVNLLKKQRQSGRPPGRTPCIRSRGAVGNDHFRSLSRTASSFAAILDLKSATTCW